MHAPLPDPLPTDHVGAFIDELASQHQVTGARTALNDWADAVTRASGDDVALDDRGRKLVALTRLKVLTLKQASRLLANYVDERPASPGG